MTATDELFDSATPLASDLKEGVKTLALNQKIPFVRYGRVVLPIDGYVFWVRHDLLVQPMFNQQGLTTAAQQADEEMTPPKFAAIGSLHYVSDIRQEESENYSANRIIFTSTEEVQAFREIAPDVIWIGEFEGMRFAFSNLSSRYQQAGLWHYQGFAVYPDMVPQIIDDVRNFSTAQIVSNSLPFWLQIQGYAPVNKFWGPLPILFPSFLAPLNEPPPFGTVHVVPDTTRGLASAPTIDNATSTHVQLAAESVRITLWGANNGVALDFLDAVNTYSAQTGNFGLMNIPVPRDEKRTQSELGIIAQKKVIDFEVSYLQTRARNVAVQTIKKATPSFYVNGKPV